MPYLTRKT